MGYQICFNRKMRLVQLIELEQTGGVDELANKLKVSKRTIFRYIDELKDRGALIQFSYNMNSYIFLKEFNFIESFFLSAIK